MDDLVERWPGYNEQSWAQRFAELDRRFSKERDTAVKAICQLSEQQSARIQALETSLAEARRQALEEAAKVAEDTTRNYSPGTFKGLRANIAQAIRTLASDPLLDRQGDGKEG